MNQLARSYFPFVVAACILYAGCGNVSNRENEDDAGILKSPVFTSINDSIRKFPDNAGLYLRRAVMLSQQDAHEAAYSDYKKSWELDPQEETGLRYAANLSIVGRVPERMSLLKKCIDKFPGNPEFKRLLGEAYVENGEPGKAADLYDSMIRKDSNNFEAWYEKGLLMEQARDTASAIAALKKAWQLKPVNTYALELAHLYAENRNPVCLEICDAVISADSMQELVDPFFIKGIYYSNTRQYKLASGQFDSCIRRDWKFTDAYIEKGVAFFKQENYDEALNTFRMAVTVSNSSPDAYYWIGRCYEVINKKQDAIDYYERALSLDKDFTEAREALKRLHAL